MWFVTNNIDSQSIEWELLKFINIRETAQYGLEVIFKDDCFEYLLLVNVINYRLNVHVLLLQYLACFRDIAGFDSGFKRCGESMAKFNLNVFIIFRPFLRYQNELEPMQRC